ncbi:ABC transporter ATP-binding protein [Phreatobacter sp. AB_2022a]|uniref:ABC transporter ATP-binding protein n=1 Tax=Phreatobacter sp. AB_2022a TaxID=3003134 RepID=UPI002286DF42|nr:ABC transporter ATP-binding protein [Phreatobacter sp. AB_2022a]MCZ0737949.1 ABC transporter ATP-binding protein [Phreatobacter sp. AB_2022a]
MTGIAGRGLRLIRGGRAIVDGMDFEAGPSGAVAVVGPNGAGKSTLLKILAGLEPDHAGTVTIGGRPLPTLSGRERAAALGYVPQNFTPHWEITPRMLLDMGAARVPGSDAMAVDRALDAGELAELADRRWSGLSGGERARALLAAVTVTDPPVLIADEPGASLDIRHRIDLVRSFAARGRSKLVIVALHEIELATTWFDRIVVVDHGRIAADMPTAELVETDVLRQVFQVAFETVTVDGIKVARPAAGRHV